MTSRRTEPLPFALVFATGVAGGVVASFLIPDLWSKEFWLFVVGWNVVWQMAFYGVRRLFE